MKIAAPVARQHQDQRLLGLSRARQQGDAHDPGGTRLVCELARGLGAPHPVRPGHDQHDQHDQPLRRAAGARLFRGLDRPRRQGRTAVRQARPAARASSATSSSRCGTGAARRPTCTTRSRPTGAIRASTPTARSTVRRNIRPTGSRSSIRSPTRRSEVKISRARSQDAVVEGRPDGAVALLRRRDDLGQPDQLAQSDDGPEGAHLVHVAGPSAATPAFCQQGSNHPSAKAFPDQDRAAACLGVRSEDAEVHARSAPASARITCSSPKTPTTRCGSAAAAA